MNMIKIATIALLYSSALLTQHNKIGENEFKLRQAMRELWTDHAVWTHEFIVADVENMPNKDLVSQRLLKNQEDIGNAIIPFYGAEAGTQLTNLLKEHILIGVDVIDAAKINDKTKLSSSNKKWHKNANDIAAFLSKANPNWSEADLNSMLNDHLSLTTQEAVAQIQKNWAEEITMYDKVVRQLWMMADDLSNGIVKQFPEKFQQ